MISIGSFYRVVASEVESITVFQDNAEYPYRLKVMTKTGHEYSIAYKAKAQRDQEAERIAREVDRENREATPSSTAIRLIVAGEVDKLRPYLQRIEEYLNKDTKEELVQRLAAYEDTGYAPEEIVAAIEQARRDNPRMKEGE